MLLIYNNTDNIIREKNNLINELKKKNEDLQKENELLKNQISIIFTTDDNKYLCFITCNSTDEICSLVNKLYEERKEMKKSANFFFLGDRQLDITKGVEFYGIKHKSVIKVKSVESNK